MPKMLIALCTAPDIARAQALTQEILGARLAACVNLVPGMTSHYWWQEKLECATEVLMIIKTTAECVSVLKACVGEHHDYDTPELIFVPVTEGLEPYIDWVQKETRHGAGS